MLWEAIEKRQRDGAVWIILWAAFLWGARFNGRSLAADGSDDRRRSFLFRERLIITSESSAGGVAQCQAGVSRESGVLLALVFGVWCLPHEVEAIAGVLRADVPPFLSLFQLLLAVHEQQK